MKEKTKLGSKIIKHISKHLSTLRIVVFLVIVVTIICYVVDLNKISNCKKKNGIVLDTWECYIPKDNWERRQLEENGYFLVHYNKMTQLTIMDYGQPITPQKKEAQRNLILRALYKKPQSCLDFLNLGIAQYNARIYELRRMGYNIKYDGKWKVFVIKND